MRPYCKPSKCSDAHISKIVRSYPKVLSSDCENVILPKLEFFNSLGFSSAALAKFVANSPQILSRSLVNTIIPTWNFLKCMLKTNERTIIVARRVFSFLPSSGSEAPVTANIDTLRGFGVRESNIMYLLKASPLTLMIASDKFKVTVKKVKQMGCSPEKVQFVRAIAVVAGLKKSTWEKKVEICKKWGWSEDDVYLAFVKQPNFMSLSEHKMTSVMDILINKYGFSISDVVNRPECFTYSLEKRVVPRCFIYQVMLKKGLIRKKWSLRELLGSTDTQFEKKITVCSRDAAPEILKLYCEKLENSK